MINKDPNFGKILETFNFETQKEELTKALKDLCDCNYINNDEEKNNDNHYDNDDDEISDEDGSGPNLIAGVLNKLNNSLNNIKIKKHIYLILLFLYL